MRHTWTRRASLIALIGAGALSFPASFPAVARETHTSDFGVLVMAHGGGKVWNSSVEAMLTPLSRDYPLEIAFGMADPASLQAGVSRLEARGVRRIAVVRLFVSGESWLERTEQILGLQPGAAPRPESDPHDGHGGGHGGHDMALWRIETGASFALSIQGLAEAPEMGAVLARRARVLSRDPGIESILIIAHGPEDDAENERWLAHIDARAQSVRQAAPFRAVRVETLREDWPEKRAASEARIRAFVDAAAQGGGRVIVLPFRVQGFGPYAETLAGLNYVADRQGLLPGQEVEAWVLRQATELRGGPFRRSARSNGE